MTTLRRIVGYTLVALVIYTLVQMFYLPALGSGHHCTVWQVLTFSCFH